jgi:hypothetical protein
MAGTTEVLKDVMGRRTKVSEHKQGDFFGELAILMATAAPASVREDSLPLGAARSSTPPGIDSTLARVQRGDLTDP